MMIGIYNYNELYMHTCIYIYICTYCHRLRQLLQLFKVRAQNVNFNGHSENRTSQGFTLHVRSCRFLMEEFHHRQEFHQPMFGICSNQVFDPHTCVKPYNCGMFIPNGVRNSSISLRHQSVTTALRPSPRLAADKSRHQISPKSSTVLTLTQ